MVIVELFKKFTKLFVGKGLGRNKIIGRIYNSISKKVLPEFIEYEGFQLFLDSEDSINFAMTDMEHEFYELSLFKEELNEGNFVLDIGANIGLYTLAASKIVNDSGFVFSFEPDPKSFANLKHNIERNMIQNVVLINKAVSSNTGSAHLFCSTSKTHRVFNYLTRNEGSSEQTIDIKTISLDDFFKTRSQKVDVIKIDVEGWEFEAFKGMTNLIKTNSTLKIFLEFNPYTLTRSATNIPEFINFLHSSGFIFYNINEKKKEKKLVDKNWLLNFAKNTNLNHNTNLLCIKN